MSRSALVSIAAALVLAPLTTFAAEKAASRPETCDCGHAQHATTRSSAPVQEYRGTTQAELERIWAPTP